MTNLIRVMIVDDHVLVRAGLRALLRSAGDIEVVAEAGSGREAVGLAGKLRPDVVLMDISMPELNGLEATAQLLQASSGSRVVMLSMHSTEEHVLRALRAGACGYLLKNGTGEELELAVRAAARGESYMSPAVSRQVIDSYLTRTDGHESDYDRLTPRQREILQLLAEGRRTKEIAHDLQLSVKTVETHRAQLMERLGLDDLASLVRYAIRKGLVSDTI